MTATTPKGAVYPRFIGVDSNGDFVWELPTGRWTWGDDPYSVVTRERTFTPDRYLEKYGPVRPLVIVRSESGQPPIMVLAKPGEVQPEPPEPAPPGVVDRGGVLGVAGQRGAYRALKRVLDVLDGWIDGAKANHDALEHRGESTGDECWTRFHPDDIRNMVNDAAREVGVTEPWNKREDNES